MKKLLLIALMAIFTSNISADQVSLTYYCTPQGMHEIQNPPHTRGSNKAQNAALNRQYQSGVIRDKNKCQSAQQGNFSKPFTYTFNCTSATVNDLQWTPSNSQEGVIYNACTTVDNLPLLK